MRYLFYFLSLSIVLAGCSKPVPPEGTPVKGVANWQSVTLVGLEHASLEGEWEFYWQALLTPDDFSKGTVPQPHYIRVPGSWTANPDTQGELHPAKGFATFRLNVTLKEPIQNPGLLIPMIWGARKVWVNGQLVDSFGIVGKQENSGFKGVVDGVVPFQMSDNTIEIIVQVSNYNFFLSGIKETFYVGTYDGVFNRKELINAGNLIWIGCLLIMAIYHFVLWFFRKRTISTLYFGAICTIMAIKVLDFGDHYLYEYFVIYLDGFVLGIQPKIYYLSIFVVVPFGLLYVRSLYPIEAHAKVVKVLVITAFAYTALAAVLPLAWMFAITPILVGATAVFALYIVYVLVKAALHKRPESTWQMVGIVVIVLTAVNDILHTQGIGGGIESELIPVGFGVFLLIQLFVLSYRFSVAFNKVEDLSENLEIKVEQRTEELTKSTKELQKAYDNITHSVRYARRIQNAMLGTGEQILTKFPQSFIFFRPRDIVSGDFYWYAQKNKKKIVVVADCTGHGVPGAFMTIVGNQILDEVVNEYNITEPCDILYRVEQRLFSLLYREHRAEQTKDGMDMVVLVFDEIAQKVTYSGAKNPLCYVTTNSTGKTEMHRIKGSKFTIESVPATQEKIFETHEVPLAPGTTFYMFSDGYQDQFGGDDAYPRKYMSAKFREFLFQISGLPMEKQQTALAEEFDRWKGTQRQTDDVLVVGIRY